MIEQYLDKNNRPTATQVLQHKPKFKSLLDQLEYGLQAREVAAEALMRISKEYGPPYFAAKTRRIMSMLENDNVIIFTNANMEVLYPDHRRPLYLEAQINDVFMRRALVDTGSSLNIDHSTVCP